MSEASAHMSLNFEVDCEPNVVKLDQFGTVSVTFLPCAAALIQRNAPKLSVSLNPAFFEASLRGHDVITPEDAPPLNIYASAYPRRYGEPPKAYIVRDADGKIVERNMLVSIIKQDDLPPARPKSTRKPRIPEKYNLKRQTTKHLGNFAWWAAGKVVDSKIVTKIAGPMDDSQIAQTTELNNDLKEEQILLSTVDVLKPLQGLDTPRQAAVARVTDINSSLKESSRNDKEGLGAGILTLSAVATASLVFISDPAPRFIVPALAAAGIAAGLKTQGQSVEEYKAGYEEKMFAPNPDFQDWPQEALVFARAIRQNGRLFSFERH